MARTKLPPAKDWRARNIDDWNVSTWHSYLIEIHSDKFGCDYVPYRGWQAEKGLIKNVTQKHGNAVIKRFIDEAIDEYKPTRQYPGTSFGWLWAYRQTLWQRVQTDILREEKREELKAQKEPINGGMSDAELRDWL